MRDIRFKTFAVGHLANPWEHKTLIDFIVNDSGIGNTTIEFGVIPPLHIFNEFLEKGEEDIGMGSGLEWKPFSISQAEYDELVEYLQTDPNYNVKIDDELWECKTYAKWQGRVLSKYGHSRRKKR